MKRRKFPSVYFYLDSASPIFGMKTHSYKVLLPIKTDMIFVHQPIRSGVWHLAKGTCFPALSSGCIFYCYWDVAPVDCFPALSVALVAWFPALGNSVKCSYSNRPETRAKTKPTMITKHKYSVTTK